jgi:hypothetical protein
MLSLCRSHVLMPIRIGKEEDRRSIQQDRRISNRGKAPATALCPEARKYDAVQLAVKIAFCGDKNSHLRRFNRRLMRAGIISSGNAAPSRHYSPRRSGALYSIYNN